jgi:hypothetical protein
MDLVGRAVVAQALVAGFQPWWSGFDLGSNYVGSVIDGAALGHIFSEYFGLPCRSFIPLTVPQPSSSIIHGCYNRLINGCINSELGSTPAP